MSDNIKVAIRVRPLIQREQNEKLREQWDVQNNLIYPIDANGKKNGDSYVFDHIFHGNCSNEDIYKTVVHPVVDGAINGFNGTIFAYGQTSSGKTYTMMGNDEEPGLISIAVDNIFLAIQRAVDRKFLLRVSYMEIYNEKVYDLLDIKNIVTIHENAKGIILNLKEEYADCPEKVTMAMKIGDKARRIGETSMNDKSSRSHAIFRIIIESSDVKDDKGVVVNVAHLNLVDLAGSERAAQTKATGMRLKEGANINKSLSTLSLVMKQLSESQDFINFRDSKLTRILQSSLGGNALTAIICAVTPAALEETHSTLAFASRAKIVKNKPCLNEVLTDEAVIIRYALQIKKLKKDLEEAKDKAKYHEQLQEKIGRIEKYMIYSSKSTDKKKANTNRRQTWCAPRHREALPSIDEIDILKSNPCIDDLDNLRNIKLTTIIGSEENLDNEFAEDLVDLEVERRNLPCTQRKLHHPFSLTRGLSLPSKIPQTPKLQSKSEPILIPESNEPEKTNETGIDTKEVVTWLVNETGTPKSVLRDRASYYNNELKALKELTDQEKELLYMEHKKETEKLRSKIYQLEEDLKCEETIKNQLKIEKTIILNKNDELKKKNAELSRINFQLQKVSDKNNDSEYMLEMMQEKFKKRESELLEQLTEARLSLSNLQEASSINTEFSQSSALKPSELTSQSEISIQTEVSNSSSDLSQFDSIEDANYNCEDIFKKLIDYKEKINSMKEELEMSDYVGLDLMTSFNALNQLSDELTNDLKHCPEDIQEEFSTLKYMHQNIMYSFSLEKIVRNHELESRKYVNRIAHTQQKELTYEKLVKEQSEAIMQLSKQEQELQNQLDLLEKSQKHEIDELKKEYAEVIKLKDKEIEDLSDKIMEYIDLITPLEEDSKKYKELLEKNANLKEETSDPSNSVKEVNEKLDSFTAQINSLSQELESNKNELITSNATIEQLKADLGQKSQEILTLQSSQDEKFNEFKDTIQSLTEQLETKSETVAQLEIEINNKQQEISDLIKEKSGLQNEFTEFKKLNEELNLKYQELQQVINETNQKVRELDEELKIKEDTLKEVREEFNHKLELLEINNVKIKEQSELLQSKNIEIETLKEKLDADKLNEIKLEERVQLHEEQILLKDDKIHSYKNELRTKKGLIAQLSDEIELLNEKITTYESHIDALASQIEEQSKQAELKNNIILELSNQNKSSILINPEETIKSDKLIDYENEIKNYKQVCNDQVAELASIKERLNDYQNKFDHFHSTLTVIQNIVSTKFGEYIKVNEDNKMLTQLLQDTENAIEQVKTEIADTQEYSPEHLKQLVINYSLELEKFNSSPTNKKLEENKELLEQKRKQVKELSNELANMNEQIVISKLDMIPLEEEKEALEQHLNKLKQQESESNTLDSNIEEQDLEINKLTDKLEDTQKELESHEANMERLKSSIKSYKQQIEEYIEAKDNFEKLLRDKEDVKRLLNEKISEYKEQQTTVINNIGLLKEQIISSTSNLENMQQEIILKSENQCIEDNDQDEEIARLCAELTEHEEQFKNYELDVKKLTDILTWSDKFSREIENKRSVLDIEIESLRSNSEKQTQEIQTLNTRIQELNDEIKVFKDCQNEEQDTEQYTPKIAELTYQIESLTKEKQKHEEQIEELNKIREQFIIIKSHNVEYVEKNIIMEKEIEKMRKQIQECNSRERGLKDKLERFQELCNSLTADCLHKERTNLDNNNTILRLTQELQRVTTEFQSFSNDKEKYEIQVLHWKTIEDEFNILKSQNQSFNAMNTHLRGEIDKMQTQIQELKTRDVDLEKLYNEMETIKSDCLLKENANIEYREKIQNLNDELQKTSNKLQSVSIEKQKYEEQLQELNSIREEFNIIKSQNLDLTGKNSALDEEIEKMRSQIQEKDSREIELEEKLKFFEGLCIEIDTLKAYCLQKEQANIEYNKNIQHLTAELDKTSIELQTLKNQFTDKEYEMKTIKHSLEIKQLEVLKINEELNQKNEELKILKNDMTKANVMRGETESKYNKDIQEKQNEIKQLKDKINLLEKCQLDENFKNEFNSMMKSHMTKLNKHNELIKNISVYSEKIESCNKAVNLIRSQLETTKNALKTKEEQLNIVLAKILNHMKPKCEISPSADIQAFTQQCNLAFSNNEIKKLRHENSEYKALVAKIRQKANTQIGNFQNILVNVQAENEKLKIAATTNESLIKTLEERITTLQNEISQTSDKDSVFAALQAKIKVLEDDKKELKSVGNYLQEQTTQKITELKEYKMRLDFLKKENAELLKSNTDYLNLRKKLTATEETLKTAQSTIKQLQMEKDNVNSTSRSLEESLEDVKFELYALKNKERERMKKHKRRSLHDSSRVLSEIDEPTPTKEENKEKYEDKKDEETQMNSECERCKIRPNENENQTQEDVTNEISQLKEEIKVWRRKYNACKDLCIIRKRKIDELEVDRRRGRE